MIWQRIATGAIFALTIPSTTYADVRFVRSDAPPGGDGKTWTNAFGSVQVALADARSDPSVDEIWVAAGTYSPDAPSGDRDASFALIEGVDLYGGFVGNEVDRSSRDPWLNVTELSGDLNGDDTLGFGNRDDNSYHVVAAAGLTSSTIFDGFRVSGGNADGGGERSLGGAFYAVSGCPTIAQCSFWNNRAVNDLARGGAFYVSDTKAIVRDSLFVGNIASGGGAIYALRTTTMITSSTFRRNADGIRAVSSDLVVDGSTFEENDRAGIFGDDSRTRLTASTFVNQIDECVMTFGGEMDILACSFTSNLEVTIRSSDTTRLAVTDCQFLQNLRALSIRGASGVDTDVRLVGCLIEGHPGEAGGAMDASEVNLSIKECTFRDNVATSGGAISIRGSIATTRTLIEDTVFENNRASSTGGAIYALSGERGTSTIIDIVRCRFDRNHGKTGGGIGAGGVLAVYGGCPEAPIHVSVVDTLMSASRRGAIALQHTEGFPDLIFVDIKRTTIANVTSSQPAVIIDNGGVVTVRDSILWGNGSTMIDQKLGAGVVDVAFSCVKGGFDGEGNIDGDPLFVDYSPRGDFHLQTGSPCVDAATPTNRPPGKDLDGDPRFVDGRLDGGPQLDMGFDELNHLHLDISGAFTPGGLLTLDTLGPNGMIVFLFVGTESGELPIWALGTLFLDLTQPWFLIPWGVAPSSIDITIPGDVPSGTFVVFQQAGFVTPGATLSNPVGIDIQ